ncbi:hypothetical protein [Bradyrhizobium sp. UFLA05-153]
MAFSTSANTPHIWNIVRPGGVVVSGACWCRYRSHLLRGLEVAQEADQILQAAAEAINAPGRDHVDLAGGDILQQPIEARTLVAAVGAADVGVLVEACDHPARALSDRLQLAALVLRGLSVSADTSWPAPTWSFILMLAKSP